MHPNIPALWQKKNVSMNGDQVVAHGWMLKTHLRKFANGSFSPDRGSRLNTNKRLEEYQISVLFFFVRKSVARVVSGLTRLANVYPRHQEGSLLIIKNDFIVWKPLLLCLTFLLSLLYVKWQLVSYFTSCKFDYTLAWITVRSHL